MRIRPLSSLLATVALASSSALVVTAAAPASAAPETRIVSGSSDRPWIQATDYGYYQTGRGIYGKDSISLSINVQDVATGSQVYNGGLTVQVLPHGTSTWRTLATSESAYLYKSIPARYSGTYRVLYAGDATYTASSTTKTLKLQRNIDPNAVTKNRKVFLQGKVSPSYKRKPVIIQTKAGGWKTFKKVKTNAKGRYSVMTPGTAKGKFYRVLVKGGKGWATSTSVAWKVTRSRY